MNKDVYFGYNPSVNIKRSKFDMSYRIKTGFNNGLLIPLGEPIEVYPGDTFSVDVNTFVRMTPTINVPMDDIIFDMWWFFVPNRILWNHWKEFCGENNSDPWTSPTTYTVPHIFLSGSISTGYSIKADSILSYMGIPMQTNVSPFGSETAPSLNALPIRAYCCIWNSFFMDENYDYPILFDKSDSNTTYSTNVLSNYQDAKYGNSLLPLKRFHDLFSSGLPEPQFGDAVRIPITDSYMFVADNPSASSTAFNAYVNGTGTNAGLTTGSYASGASTTIHLNPEVMCTIDALRLAILSQRYLWQLGNYGRRYVELIKGFFGVTAPDYLLDRPILLGTTRFNINISPVVQTSASEDTTFDGDTLSQSKGSISGYSATRSDNSLFTHSFVEHGYLVPVFGTRTHRSYSQGISKMWMRRNFLDYYNPIFASIGSQPTFTYQLYAGKASTQVNNSRVWAYNEAWAELRYNNDLVTGILKRQDYLYWTFADSYSGIPTMSSDWLNEGMANLNRNLYIAGSETTPQFLADFYVKMTAVRPLPVHSVPGLSPYL